MSLLWWGQEAEDFPVGTGTIFAGAGYQRSGFARQDLAVSGQVRSNPFPGGAVTSAWFTAYAGYNSAGAASFIWFGLVSGNTQKGIHVGIGANSSRLAVFKYDGTTLTNLCEGTTDIYFLNSSQVRKIDCQIISYGASGTVNLYVNQVLYATFTGNIAVAGVSNLDTFQFSSMAGNNRGISEMIVADEDTRGMGLVSQAPNALGTTHDWPTGTFSDVNDTSIPANDATLVNTNTVGQDEQFNLTDLPAGTYTIRGSKITARVSSPAGSTATQIKLGFNSGGTVAAGTAQTPGVGFGTLEAYYTPNNPVTSAPWAQSEMNPLQVNLRSA